MTKHAIHGLFEKNLTEYQKEINLFVLKVCLSGGVLGLMFFCGMKATAILDRIDWPDISKFGIMSLINLAIPTLFYFIVVKKNNKNTYVNIFKYILITCAAVNYYSLISCIPYYEMWSSIFLIYFLSSFCFWQV